MQLNLTISGDGPGDPVLLAHGLFGQARNLGGLARRLATSRRVISVDMRNHGDSPWNADHSYPAMADDLAQVIADHGGRADLVGHSMGGKAAMALALRHPGTVGRLAVLDIAPIDYGHSQDSLAAAMQETDLAGLNRRSDADRRLAAQVTAPGVRAFLLQSLDLKAEPPRWRLNLPVLRDQMDLITGWPADLQGKTFPGPALFLPGAQSDYVTEAGKRAIRDSFPQARIVTIKGAGHWLHADAPEAVSSALAMFFGAA